MQILIASLFIFTLSFVSCSEGHIASKREGLIPHRTKPLTNFSMEVNQLDTMQAEEAPN